MIFRRNRFILGFGLVTIFFGISVSAQVIPAEDELPAQTSALISDKRAVTDSIAKIEGFVETTSNKMSTDSSTSSNSYLKRSGINASQTKSLTLDQAIRLALNNNNDIEIARDDVRIAELGLKSLLGSYDGIFTINPNYDRNSTTGQKSTGDLRINSDFTQLIRPGGGNYRVFFNNSRTENAFAQAQATQGNIGSGGTSGLYFTGLGVAYTQPLFRNFKTDNNRRQIKIQRKRIAQTDADFRRQTIQIISQVQRTYWDLVFALRDQQNRVANLNLTQENLRQIEARIEAGAAAPLQRAEVATELATRESDVLVALQQVSIAENLLKQLLLKDPNAPEWSESLIPTDSPVINFDDINLQDALDDAIRNRPELNRLKLEAEVNKIDVDFFKNQTKPRIDLNSSFSLEGISSTVANNNANGLNIPLISGDPNTNADAFLLDQIRKLNGGNPTDGQIPTVFIPTSPGFLSGGFTQGLRNIFRSDAPNYSVGVTISFPLKNTQAKADLASARIQEERIVSQKLLQEQAIIAEVRNAVQAVETAQKRVLTARRARENAQIQLDGEQKLYDVGRSTTFLLFQRQNTLTNSRNAEIRAETDYNKALADLQRATSTTLQLNNVIVDSPMDDNINDNDGDGT